MPASGSSFIRGPHGGSRCVIRRDVVLLTHG